MDPLLDMILTAPGVIEAALAQGEQEKEIAECQGDAEPPKCDGHERAHVPEDSDEYRGRLARLKMHHTIALRMQRDPQRGRWFHITQLLADAVRQGNRSAAMILATEFRAAACRVG